MKTKTKAAFASVVFLWVASTFVWPGCIILPIPATHTPVAFRTKADFKFKQTPPVSRGEVIAKIGPPDEYFPDLRVACYKFDTVRKREVVLLLFVLPVPEPSGVEYREDAFIEFDKDDLVKRAEIIKEPDNSSNFNLGAAAEEWVAKENKTKH